MRMLVVAVVACSSPSRPEVIANTTEPPVTSLFPARFEACTADGWCRFADPPPLRVSGIWVSERAVWAGGHVADGDENDEDDGAVARWNGRQWRLWKLGGAAYFSIDGLTIDGADRVFASGRGTPVRHYDRETDDWKAVEEDNNFHETTQIAVSETDVFVTINGNILRRADEAPSWHSAHDLTSTSIYDHDVYDLDVDDAGGAWAIVRAKGQENRVYRWDRKADRFEPVDVHRNVYRISARTPEDVVVAGVAGVVRFDGRAWREIPLPKTAYTEVKHRGTQIVLLESPGQSGHVAVWTVAPDGARVTMPLPDDPEELAVGPDGSLWAAGTSEDAVWFQRPPTSGSGR